MHLNFSNLRPRTLLAETRKALQKHKANITYKRVHCKIVQIDKFGQN